MKLQGSSRDAFERGPKQSRGPKEAPVRTQADSREVLERLRAVSRGCKEAPGIATRIDRTPCSCRRPGAAVSAPSQALRSALRRSRALSGPCRRRRVGAAVALASGLAPSLASGLAGLAPGLGPGPRRLRRPRHRPGRSQARSGFVENATFSLPTWMETKNKVRDAR